MAAIMPPKSLPSIVDGINGCKCERSAPPRTNGRAIKTNTPPTLSPVPATWSVPPNFVPRTFTVVTTRIAEIAAIASQISPFNPNGAGTS